VIGLCVPEKRRQGPARQKERQDSRVSLTFNPPRCGNRSRSWGIASKSAAPNYRIPKQGICTRCFPILGRQPRTRPDSKGLAQIPKSSRRPKVSGTWATSRPVLLDMGWPFGGVTPRHIDIPSTRPIKLPGPYRADTRMISGVKALHDPLSQRSIRIPYISCNAEDDRFSS
jgi:hypothetical protein